MDGIQPPPSDQTHTTGDRDSRRRFTTPVSLVSWATLGISAFSAFFLLALVLLTLVAFAARIYSHKQPGYISLGMAICYGMMAFTCIATLMAMASKANIVARLTSISHERLNALYYWTAWLSFVLSLTPTLPYLCQSVHGYVLGRFPMVKLELYARSLSAESEVSFFAQPTIYSMN